MTGPDPRLEGLLSHLSALDGEALYITRNNLPLAERLAAASPRLSWTVLSKNDLRGVGGQGLLGKLRSRRWTILVIEDHATEAPRRRDLYRALLMAGRGGSRWLVFSAEAGAEGEAGGGPAEVARIHRFRSLGSVVSSLIAEGLTTARALWWSRRFTGRLRRGPRPAVPPAPPPADNRRVAVLRTDFWFGLKAGGSVSHALGVLNGMKSLGLEPRMWTTSVIPGAEEVPQTEVLPAPRPAILEEAAMAGFNRTFLDRAESAIREFNPAVVYQRHSILSLAGLALARRLGVPLVLEVNNSEVWWRETYSRLYLADLARNMERTAFEQADRLVLISEELIPPITEMGGDESRMVINPNGVEVERFDPAADGSAVRRRLNIPGRGTVCGFLGTFTRWHGVLFLAEQMPQVLSAHPELTLLLIGDGDLRPEVERRLREAGVADRVRFVGLLPPGEVSAHLAACDILLSPHLPFEDGTPFFGSPTKLFEYMAAGRPVVASRLGQIGRVIEDGETGLLFTPGDGDEFRKAVGRLMADPALRQRLGRAAREKVEQQYTWGANTRRALEGLITLPSR